MTTIDTRAQSASADDRAAAGVQSVGAWLTTTDHKRLGRVLIGGSLLVLAAVGVVAVLLGFERVSATSDFLNTGALPQMFSLYRIGLTFGVLLPLMLGITLTVVPLQIGGRSLTFARVGSAGTWGWLMGLGLMIASILANGGPGGGDSRFVALYLTSMILMLLGVLAIAVSLATTILTARAPGMNMRRVPLFTWSALIASLGLVLAVPVLLGTTIYTYIDYRGGRTGFGGNTGIMEWLGFGSSQMMTFVYALPVFGFAAETVATATGKRFPLRTTAYLGMGLVGVAALGAITQNTADLRVDILDASFRTALHDVVPFAFFNLLPLLGGVIVLGMCALALAKSRPALGAPLVFALFGLLMLLVALAANVVDRVGDAHLGGTVFEEGVWIAIVYGAVLCGLGAFAYWGPKLTGRLMPTMQTVPLALLGLLAAALASLPYLVAGFAKQPANATQFSYGGPQELWNVLASIGHGLMVITVVAFVGLFARSARHGAAAGDDPWNGQTLEWATSSPAPEDNFPEVHIIASAEPLIDLKPVASSRELRERGVMIALPAAPAPAPRRQLIVGTALASAGAATLIGGMLGLWMRFREHAHDTGVNWVPRGVQIPEVASNVMLIGFLPIVVFAQWAVYAARRNDKHHVALALGLIGLLGIALINAQANIYAQMDLALADGPYAPMFYALTGVFMVLLVIGVGFSAITAFRFLGGRTTEREIVAAHAIYWYVLSVLFFALWFVVYVTK